MIVGAAVGGLLVLAACGWGAVRATRALKRWAASRPPKKPKAERVKVNKGDTETKADLIAVPTDLAEGLAASDSKKQKK